VRILDDGIGISPEMIAKIFDLFMQVDDSLERAQGGLGIGLSLVKRLVELHSGTVEARSKGPGAGSEFVVRLPIAARPASVDAAPRPAADAPIESVARRVLVADDNEDSATSLALLLSMLGHETRTASDGAEAVKVAAEFRPEIAFLDIGMPRLNGYEAARQIRESPTGRHAVLVALTGWGQAEDRIRSSNAGFDAHLVKPVDFAEVRQILERFLSTEGS
jgi:CheY-like chemotaxis protein